LKPETPASKDAEENLIGICIIDNDILDDTHVPPEAFHAPRNEIIWRTMLNLRAQGMGVDLPTLVESLRVTGDLASVGDVPYIAGLAEYVGVSAYWDQYQDTILDRHKQRQIIRLSERTAQRAYELVPPQEILDGLEADLTTLTTRRNDTIERALESAARYATGTALVSTGFETLDKAFGGFTRNDFTVIGARTSTGKSAFIHEIANRIGHAEDAPVTIFTPDQPIPEVLALQAAREAMVPLSHFRHQIATEEQKARYLQKLDELQDGFLKRVNFKSGVLTLESFQVETLRAIRAGSCAIVVDTINRISSKTDKMHTTIAQFGTMAKAIAAEYDVPIIGLAQIRRELDWEDRMPTRADLADAPGSLANDANMILLLHRDKTGENPYTMNVIIDKAKADAADGRVVSLRWDPDYATIRE